MLAETQKELFVFCFCLLVPLCFFQIFLSERVEAADYWVTSTNK